LGRHSGRPSKVVLGDAFALLPFDACGAARDCLRVRTVELTIEDVAFGGNGVGRDNGEAVFVPFTIDGERVAARVIREKKNFAEAEIIEVIETSSHRVEPPCPYFGRCGGCSYQHISYSHQLEIKARQVEQTLRRIARLDPVPMRPIVPSPAPYEYRNRITVHALDGEIGFYRRDEHQLIDIEFCPISRPEVNAELARLRTGRVRDGHYTLRAHSVPRIFAQTNDAVAEELARIVAGMIASDELLLIDAYCGSGFFTKRLLDNFAKVIGIDWDRFAVEAAMRDATDRETYLAGEVDAYLQAVLPTADLTRTTVIVDPPAPGLSESARAALLGHPPPTLIYVSCNPPTLARDLGALANAFRLESVTPLDMFPQTAEIEVAVHLSARRVT
jgi:23S rRNA (uracil1939-C5)-methyltransferase